MINRLVGVVAALCIVLLAAPAPSGAIADVPGLSSVTHSYCTPVYDQPNSYTAPERGPPTTYDHAYACNADVRWSRGVLARPGGSTSFARTTYDDRVVLAPEAPVTTTAGGGVEVTSGGLVSPERVHVATKTTARACSFTGATVVLMADGTRKPIEDIEVGDLVVATDPETGEQEARRVAHVFVHDDTVVDLVIDGEVLATTEDHPFWSVTDQKFERADELSPGEKVLGADGRVITVSGLELGAGREALAYNLSVEGIHTYHVGESEILVHNNCFTALDALSDPRAVKGLTPSQIDDLASTAGLEVAAGKAGAKNPATRYYLPGTNRSQGFRVLPRGVAGESGVKGGAYLKYFGGPLHGKRVELGAP